jgi:hypothetical protein
VSPDPERIELALAAVSMLCRELAKQDCDPAEVATALASMLGVVVAAVDCCPEHAQQAEEVVVEIFEDSLATTRKRFAAFERVGAAGLHRQEGHA